MYNASDRKDIRRAEKAAKQSATLELDYLKAAMSVIQGRAWFHNLLEACHIFDGTQVFESNRDYFRAGERNIGLRLFEQITTHCPDHYIQMMREANDRRIERDAVESRAAVGERSLDADSGGGDQESGDSPTNPTLGDNFVDYGAQAE